MLSLRARLIIFLMRNRHLLAGKKKKETYDENTSIAAFREQCERGAARYAKIPEGIRVVPEIIPCWDYSEKFAARNVDYLAEVLPKKGLFHTDDDGFYSVDGGLSHGGGAFPAGESAIPPGRGALPADEQGLTTDEGGFTTDEGALSADELGFPAGDEGLTTGGQELPGSEGGFTTAVVGLTIGELGLTTGEGNLQADKPKEAPSVLTAGDHPGINAEWLVPSGADPEKLILYVHGGGYVSGSCSDHRGFVSKFAKTTGHTCLVYEYRLAPEHPFPAAVDDSVTVYSWLLDKGFNPANILVAGESAGGGLTLVLLLALKERKIPLPVAAVAISPWADLTCSGPSYQTKNKVSLAPLNSWHVFSKHYRGASAPNHPLISPVFGDLQGLPPIFINAGTDDELYDDGELFAEKARLAGVDVTFRAGAGMFHCYPLMAPMFREATEAMNEITSFIKKWLK